MLPSHWLQASDKFINGTFEIILSTSHYTHLYLIVSTLSNITWSYLTVLNK